MMLNNFSKPFGDIEIESASWLAQDDEILNRQTEGLRKLIVIGHRHECLLCGASLADCPSLNHRSIVYISCLGCGHLQTEDIVEELPGAEFDTIYPPIDQAAWQSRRDRIYTPKLEWILKCLNNIGVTREEAFAQGWLEVGAGAGYFLGALLSAGGKNIAGIDANPYLSERANQVLGRPVVMCTDAAEEAIVASKARIITSFFVLEHLSSPTPMIEALASKPSGTVFAFAVPTYGFAALLEGVSTNHAARSLDGIVHRQLYTDRSIDHLLGRIDYVPIAQWVFGQDALDLQRWLVKGLRQVCDADLAIDIEARLVNLIEPLQHAIDKSLWADARHVLAVKR